MTLHLRPDRKDLDKVLPAIADRYDQEFLVSPFSKTAGPSFTAALVWHGYLPMASSHGDCMLPKIHYERCIVKPSEVHEAKQARKRAKHYHLTVNMAWDEVVRGVQRHTYTSKPGDNWLSTKLTEIYRGVASLPSPQNRGVVFHSVELWHKESGVLAGGEIGYTVGAVYTSATGFCLKDSHTGAGTVQLVLLGRLLAECDFEIWDLGMVMDYKKALGGIILTRQEWLSRLREFRSVPRTLQCKDCCPEDEQVSHGTESLVVDPQQNELPPMKSRLEPLSKVTSNEHENLASQKQNCWWRSLADKSSRVLVALGVRRE